MSSEEEERPGVELLRSWVNKSVKVEMSDGRVIVGIFLCTDRSGNVIVGSCNEYTSDPDSAGGEVRAGGGEGRVLGLAMVPGHHVTRMWVDQEPLGSLQRPSSPTDSGSSSEGGGGE